MMVTFFNRLLRAFCWLPSVARKLSNWWGQEKILHFPARQGKDAMANAICMWAKLQRHPCGGHSSGYGALKTEKQQDGCVWLYEKLLGTCAKHENLPNTAGMPRQQTCKFCQGFAPDFSNLDKLLQVLSTCAGRQDKGANSRGVCTTANRTTAHKIAQNHSKHSRV